MDAMITVNEIDAKNLVQSSIDNLDQASEALMNNVSDAVIHGIQDESWTFIHNFSSAYPYLDHQFGLSNEKNRRIFYYGVWRTLIELLKRSHQYNQQIYDHQAVVKQYRRLADLIDILHDSKYRSHGELASTMRMSPNSLTNLVRRIVGYNYLAVNKIGKKKIYHLTGKGQELYKYLANNKRAVKNKYSPFRFAYDLLAVVNHEMTNAAPRVQSIIKIIDRYAPLTQSEKRLILIQSDALIKKAEWMRISAQRLSDIKRSESGRLQKLKQESVAANIDFNRLLTVSAQFEWYDSQREPTDAGIFWRKALVYE